MNSIVWNLPKGLPQGSLKKQAVLLLGLHVLVAFWIRFPVVQRSSKSLPYDHRRHLGINHDSSDNSNGNCILICSCIMEKQDATRSREQRQTSSNSSELSLLNILRFSFPRVNEISLRTRSMWCSTLLRAAEEGSWSPKNYIQPLMAATFWMQLSLQVVELGWNLLPPTQISSPVFFVQKKKEASPCPPTISSRLSRRLEESLHPLLTFSIKSMTFPGVVQLQSAVRVNLPPQE